MSAVSTGQAAYEAMHAACEHGFDGCLAWTELPPDIRDGWERAAQAAIEASPELRDYVAEIERLQGLLDAAQPPAAPELAEVRQVLDAFDWETDDRQYALEKIDVIVNRGRS